MVSIVRRIKVPTQRPVPTRKNNLAEDLDSTAKV